VKKNKTISYGHRGPKKGGFRVSGAAKKKLGKMRKKKIHLGNPFGGESSKRGG